VRRLHDETEGKHLVSGFTAVAYDIPSGSVAGYYPEMNVLISLRHHDPQSGTPSYKAVPVRVTPTSS
jgi:anaerobic selenocysteine-containing dehydrogenase